MPFEGPLKHLLVYQVDVVITDLNTGCATDRMHLLRDDDKKNTLYFDDRELYFANEKSEERDSTEKIVFHKPGEVNVEITAEDLEFVHNLRETNFSPSDDTPTTESADVLKDPYVRMTVDGRDILKTNAKFWKGVQVLKVDGKEVNPSDAADIVNKMKTLEAGQFVQMISNPSSEFAKFSKEKYPPEFPGQDLAFFENSPRFHVQRIARIEKVGHWNIVLVGLALIAAGVIWPIMAANTSVAADDTSSNATTTANNSFWNLLMLFARGFCIVVFNVFFGRYVIGWKINENMQMALDKFDDTMKEKAKQDNLRSKKAEKSKFGAAAAVVLAKEKFLRVLKDTHEKQSNKARTQIRRIRRNVPYSEPGYAWAVTPFNVEINLRVITFGIVGAAILALLMSLVAALYQSKSVFPTPEIFPFP